MDKDLYVLEKESPMKSPLIITVERQFGSSGGSIGRKLAARLDVPYYDRQLINEAAEIAGITPREAYRLEENLSGGLNRIIAGAFKFLPGIDPEADYFNEIQMEVIRRKAACGSSIFIGRTAQDALTDLDPLKIYIFRPLSERIHQIQKLENVSAETALELIRNKDKQRAVRVEYFFRRKWGDAAEYDLCLNSGALGEEGCVEVITDFINHYSRRQRARG